MHLPRGCVIEVGVVGDDDILDSDHVLSVAKVTSVVLCSESIRHAWPSILPQPAL